MILTHVTNMVTKLTSHQHMEMYNTDKIMEVSTIITQKKNSFTNVSDNIKQFH